jgi:3-deoxy-manno-octulosonate cytidylyltransferase (CMP-KDO synthetase)
MKVLLIFAVHPLIVIPARFGSTRIPGKPLSKINDAPLITLVSRRVLEYGLDSDVLVATDDSRIEAAVAQAGIRSVRTSAKHNSGTERVAEVVSRPEFSQFERILNIQGDQLFLPKQAAVGALAQLEGGVSVGTAAALLLKQHESDRNRVKVAVDDAGLARSFSREYPGRFEPPVGTKGVYLHLGVYAYTRAGLLEWVTLPPTRAEVEEGLEQLRPFLNGIPIGVAVLDEFVEAGIDTPTDLTSAQQSLAPTRTSA